MTTTLIPTTSSPSSVAATAITAAPERLSAEREVGRFARAGLVSGAVAAVANLGVFFGARLADISLEIQDERIPAFGFPQLTFICAVLGIAMAAVFTRKSRKPRRAFVRTTVSLSALSMVPPVLADADTATKVVLGLTHVIAAVIIIPAIAARLAD
jgi:hypothetical protein